MLRSRVVVGIAVAGAVAVGGVGGALIGVPGLSSAQQFPKNAVPIAASAPATPAKPGVAARPGPDSPLIDAAAKALNLTPQQLLAKLSDGKTTIADVAKAQNVKIDDVIAAITNADHDRISDIVNKPWPNFGLRGPGKGFGPSALPALGGPGAFGRLGALALDPVAKALGISPADLKADLAKGQTIAQIAAAKNVSVDTVINTLVTDATKKIEQAVTNKHLTRAQADKIEAALKTEITNVVNNGFPKGPMGGFGFGGFGRGGRRGHGGPMMPGASGGSTTTPGSGSSSTTTTKPPTA